ncbi:MAG: response regulator [Blautia sp.]|jgi:two-component system chemotaxis response regulator CheY
MREGILIVDDAMFMRRIIRDALEEEGYHNLWEAGDGDEAIRIFKTKNPGMVLLDITMPGRSGMEVLKDMHEASPQTKIIMCSAIGQEEHIRRALRMGASDFIVKPFKKEELQEIVRKYLE